MKFCLLILFVSCCGQQAFGFLENATHGYSNCLTCHYSPAGGDMLNDYGRGLSAELMSTWSKPGAEGSFGGLVKETQWARLGGDFRTLQSYVNNTAEESRSIFIMQNNIEIGVKLKKLMFIGTLGTQEGPASFVPDKGDFVSERHYVMYEASPTSRIRAGKFRVNYGLNDPNHRRFIKNDLGFGSYSEKYNLEYSKFFDSADVVLNYSFGRIDKNRSSRDERSFSIKASHYLGGKSKLGLSYLRGETPNGSRSLIGTFGITPITEKSYVVYEVDYEDKDVASVKTQSLVAHTRVGYEVMKGLKTYGLYDYSRDLNDSGKLAKAPGVGLQWFPFPHFELQVEYQNIDNAQSSGTEHRGFVMAHVYY